MARRKFKSRYESEVHLGFLAIAFLLVFLNFVSNYVLHQARSAQREEALARLRRGAIVASREIQTRQPDQLDQAALEALRDRIGLSDLTLLPVKPDEGAQQGKREWFRAVTRTYPPSRYPDLARKLYQADFGSLTRGDGSHYYYLYPIPGAAEGGLLVLTVDRPDLAYLDDSRQTLMLVLIAALVVVAAVYALLSRFMFRPFRRIREQAEQAGRAVATADDETEAVVEEYERVITELTDTQTELLRLNEEIRHRADVLEIVNRGLMETSRLGVITLDRQGRIGAINDTALGLLELEPGGHAGEPYAQLLDGFDPLVERIRAAFRDEQARGYQEHSRLVERRPDTVLGVTITDIRDQEQGMTGLLLMLADQSELSRLRKELESRQRLAALGEMAGGLAHQIRNSLGAICGYGTLLKKRLKDDCPSTEAAETLLDETRVANELIDRFLTFARPFDFSPHAIDLAALVAGCVESFKIRPDLHGVDFRESYPAELEVDADPVLLKQAVANLLDNAVNAYGAAGGSVEVRLGTISGKARLEIRDFGCGIPDDAVDKIFTPFYSSRPSGTGLGLPLVAKIVALHSGTIDLASRPGEGTCFSISIPLNAIAPTEPSPSEIGTPA